MESDDSFLNMMSFGVSARVPDSPLGEQELPMSSTQDPSASSKTKFTKGKNWSNAKDDLLIAAWRTLVWML